MACRSKDYSIIGLLSFSNINTRGEQIVWLEQSILITKYKKILDEKKNCT